MTAQRWALFLVAGLVLMLGISSGATSQVPDSMAVGVDSTRIAIPDSMMVPGDSLAGPMMPPGAGDDAVEPKGKPVTFAATDSLILLLAGDEPTGTLLGKASLTASETKMESHRIDILLNENTIRASGLVSDTGMVGRPTVDLDGENFSGNEFAFNLETGRGRVVTASTKFDDGFLYAHRLKQEPDSVVFAHNAAYTTCDHEGDPHYSLRANRMKVVGGKWIYTGPLHLRVFNIPMPAWLPFGMIPALEGRRSGPLAPTYGEDRERGFYLKDFGWYWAINDYLDFQTTFGVWTLGSWQISPRLRYSKRYSYTGQMSLDWVNNRSGEPGDLNRAKATTRRFTWRHNQTLDPSTTLAADVNLTSSDYLRTVSTGYNERVQQEINSNVTFSKRWSGVGRSLTLNAGQRQVLSTGNVTMKLPQIQFSQRSTQPFKRRGGSGQAWYEKITYGYTGRLDNQYTFEPLADSLGGNDDVTWWQGLVNQSDYSSATGENQRFQFSAVHSVPLSASYAISKLPLTGTRIRLNISPRADYREEWYISTNRKTYDPETESVVTTTANEFLPVRTFNMGISANTEFYGLFPFKLGRLEGLRHVGRPSVSFTYQPDYSATTGNYAQRYYESYTDASGEEVSYSIIPRSLSGRQQNINFRLGNVFQSKSVTADSTGDEQKKIVQLFTLDMSSAYNFAAESLPFRDFTVSGRTRVLNKFDINASSSWTPYGRDSDGRKVSEWYRNQQGGKWLRFLMFNLTARTTLRSKNTSGASRPFGGRGSAFDRQVGGRGIENTLVDLDPFAAENFNTAVGYADFAIPWSLDLSLNMRVSRQSSVVQRSATLNGTFDFSLTPLTKIQGRTGYDFVQNEVVTTTVSVLRDLHCWEMALSWTPFGTYKSFQFTLQVKSGKLREFLKLKHPQQDINNRFGLLGQ